jgi:hypothetical protein
VGHNKRMSARERDGWDYGRKKNIEREMRRLGQGVREIDPEWGNVEAVAKSSEETWSRANMERGNMTGGDMIGGRGAGNGSADRDIRKGTRRPSRRTVGGECMRTEEAKPNCPSEAVVRRPGRLLAFAAFRRPGRRSVPFVPEPTRGRRRCFFSFSGCPDAEILLVSGLTWNFSENVCC